MSGREERPLKNEDVYKLYNKLPTKELVRLIVIGGEWVLENSERANSQMVADVRRNIRTLALIIKEREAV